MKKKTIFGSIVIALVVVLTGSYILTINNDEKNLNSIDDSNIISSKEDTKIINIAGNYMLGSEPTLEFLTEDADIIAIVTMNDSQPFIEERKIYTNVEFNIKKIIKNNNSSSLSNNITVKQVGGKVTVEQLRKNLTEDELTKYGISANESARTVVNFDASGGALEIQKEKEYLIFLNYEENGELMFNSMNYGIREISSDKVYNYDTNSYIETSLLD